MNRSLLLLGIFLVSLTLRVLAITIPLNSDEVLWMSRGTTFIRNLLEGDLTNTYLRHHPGVTNMWVIGSSMLLNCLLHKYFPGLLHLNLPPHMAACLDINQFPINLYILPRLVQAVITSACMVCLYLLTKRLLGQAVALCSMSLLLLEPFFLSYQRYLTTDALQADFGVLAVLLVLLYLQSGRERKLLVASGVLMGLATASKITALFLLPGVVLQVVLIELGVWRGCFLKRGWKQQLRDLGFWGATILAVFVLIFPAVWVSPSYVVSKIYKGLLRESDRGYFFFLGEMTDSPNLLFYPLVLAYRLSPVLQVGLLAVTALLIPKLRCRREKIPNIAALAVLSVCVLVILSLSSSKIDRYINLCLPILALLSAVGWLEIMAWVSGWIRQTKITNWQINQGVITALSIVVLQIVVLLPHYPYYITYYNPLLGGSRLAQHLFMIGQGEGLEKAASWLNQSPNIQQIKAASWYSSSFAAYFQGQTLSIDKYIQQGFQPWTQAHRVVLYHNQFQRQLPEQKMIAYFADQQPLYTVRLHDIDYVQVYPGPVALPEDLKRIQIPRSLSFGQQVRLLGYDLHQSGLAVNATLQVTFYWEFLAPLPSDALLKIGLRGDNGKLLNSWNSPLLNGYLSPQQMTLGTVLRDVHNLTISPNIPPQQYQLEVGWFSPSQGEILGKAVVGEVEVKQ